jgi:hypothetical protein
LRSYPELQHAVSVVHPQMKPQFFILVFLVASCSNKRDTTQVQFIRITADTSETWVGRMTREAFYQVRTYGKSLGLEQLNDGTPKEEIRVWYLSVLGDQQVVFIAKEDSLNRWSLRTIIFYRSKSDSIYADYSRELRRSAVDSLSLNSYWELTSQSDLEKGDTYGCVGGEDLFIELSNRVKYKFVWYRCPEINRRKDSAFSLVAALVNRLDALAVEH